MHYKTAKILVRIIWVQAMHKGLQVIVIGISRNRPYREMIKRTLEIFHPFRQIYSTSRSRRINQSCSCEQQL